MARKRLTPAAPRPVSGSGAEPETRPEPAPGRPLLAGNEAFAPPRRAPIADVAGEASASAALAEMAETLRAAREGGRMILALPLDRIDAGYLVRDRVAADEEEMGALMESLRARGQQTPIEVTGLGGERYGLISGWRRMQALERLHRETGEARFATILALLRRPDQASDAYLAMVEENEIRVGLSFYERARIAAKAVEQGVYPTEKAALLDLFRAASRAKRSKIRSFLTIVHALDGALRHPAAIGERLGLALAKALEADPALAKALRKGLETDPPQSAEAEQARLVAAAGERDGTDAPDAMAAEAPAPHPAGRKSPPAPRRAAPSGEEGAELEPLPGLHLRIRPDGALTLQGPAVDAAFRSRLLAWLAGTGPDGS